MKDIIFVEPGMDLGVANSQIPRAANILSVQLGALEYEPTFGIDKRYWLSSPWLFQNESFKSYLVQRLADYQINLSQVLETFYDLFLKYTFFVVQDFDPANRFTTQDIIDNVLTDADGDYFVDADGSPITDAF